MYVMLTNGELAAGLRIRTSLPRRRRLPGNFGVRSLCGATLQDPLACATCALAVKFAIATGA